MPNLLFALARAQEPPPALCGRADDIRVTLPWGDLLEGVALADPDVLGGLAALARPGARLRIVVNGEPWSTNAPKRMRRLPQLKPEYVRSELVDRYADHGIAIKDARRLTASEVDELHSTWAKKLRSGRDVDLTLIDAWLPG
ncbi:MAG TPA: hypothetical protein VEX15_18780 [Nocardioidaceae bacterium]|nr:hypothetical protein [Nocardioidaceae bacterium]